jgi:digeranylgeranylglycerophospholipid reductase
VGKIPKKYDVVVVGAGPAGSIAAMSTAERGLKTLILEKERLPRFKLCGGAIPNWIVDNLNIPQEILQREYKTVTFFTPPDYKRREMKLETSKYFGVNRDTFDYYLTKKALDAGAVLKEAIKVKKVIKRDNQVKGVITDTGESYLADIVIACDGALTKISKECGMWSKWFSNENHKWQDQMISCIGIELKMEEDIIDRKFGNTFIFFTGLDFAPTGYAWIFPKRNYVSVGLGLNYRSLKKSLSEYLSKFLKANSIISELLMGGKVTTTRGGWIPNQTPYQPSYDAGLLIAGDAASMISRISGEGIVYAIKAGRNAGTTAVEAVRQGDFSANFLSRYQDLWKLSIGITLNYQNQLLMKDGLFDRNFSFFV